MLKIVRHRPLGEFLILRLSLSLSPSPGSEQELCLTSRRAGENFWNVLVPAEFTADGVCVECFFFKVTAWLGLKIKIPISDRIMGLFMPRDLFLKNSPGSLARELRPVRVFAVQHGDLTSFS